MTPEVVVSIVFGILMFILAVISIWPGIRRFSIRQRWNARDSANAGPEGTIPLTYIFSEKKDED